MSEGHSKFGETVERISVNYDPHERYRNHDPYTGERIKPGIPILSSTRVGQVIRKEIAYHTVKCPECEIPAEYDEKNQPICPNCGIICAGKDTILQEQIVIDAAAAERVNGDNN